MSNAFSAGRSLAGTGGPGRQVKTAWGDPPWKGDASGSAKVAPAGTILPTDGIALINNRLRFNVRKAAIDQDLTSFVIDFKEAFRKIDTQIQGALDKESFRKLCEGLQIDFGFENFEDIWDEASDDGTHRTVPVKSATAPIYKVLMRNNQGYDVQEAEAKLQKLEEAHRRNVIYRMSSSLDDMWLNRFNKHRTTIMMAIAFFFLMLMIIFLFRP